MTPRTGNGRLRINFAPILLIASFLCLILLISSLSSANASYDPESVIDEIPVISAHSFTPEISRRYEAQRRNSDGDLEEVDDYDEDEGGANQPRGSSSNNHDTYENPAYGESRRAAREADDIENFFDRHIGPSGADDGHYNANGDPEEREMSNQLQAAASNQVGKQAQGDSDFPMLTPEPRASSVREDPFEMAAAASSPLATIFHSLLAAHKRPIVIETSDLSADLVSDDPPSSSQQGSGSSQSSSTASSSSSSVDGSSPTVAALGAATNSPSLAMSPIASYLSPIAAPSSVAAYGQQMMEQAVSGSTNSADENSGSQQAQPEDDGGQIQEIYIGRRPTIMSHFQSYAPQQQPQGLSHQSSNAAYWRGAAPANVGGRMMMMSPDQQQQQMSNAYNADYRQYPVAASYAHQQESAGADEDGTVEYNLSFGGGGGGSGNSGSGSSGGGGDDGPEEMSSLSVDSQASSNAADETAPPAQPMPMPYGRRPYNPYYNQQQQPDQSQSQHYQQQLQNAYRQQQEQHLAGLGVYGGRKGALRQQQHQYAKSANNHRQQQQYLAASQNNRRLMNLQNIRQSAHPARYHKDPSESVVQPINYGQFRPQQQQQQALNDYRQQQGASERRPLKLSEREWRDRQKYLAMLNREIKSSPRYDDSKSGYTKNNGKDHTSEDIYSNVQSETRNPTRVFGSKNQLQNAQLTTRNANNKNDMTRGNNNLNINNHDNINNLNSIDNNNATTIIVSSQQQHTQDNQLPLAHNSITSQQQQQHRDLAAATTTTTKDMLRYNTSADSDVSNNYYRNHNHARIKRQDDSDDRDDADDDGVWVEDDDDDDNSRQSSDLNETAQDPEDETSQGDDQGGDESGPHSQYNVQPMGGKVAGITLNHPATPMLTRPHSYEVSPDDAYAYAAYPGGL